ncbi:hypothetical protein VP01_87g4 [Puccinia sorghi]|uniref:Uncharacterized protein n=1 Tax=Puccinia sorghi TaxID=27349 RepID=A0A0L6U8G4_9BASI|nr:hypothetical protein VP01_87g4 [Puccinia sorghi]
MSLNAHCASSVDRKILPCKLRCRKTHHQIPPRSQSKINLANQFWFLIEGSIMADSILIQNKIIGYTGRSIFREKSTFNLSHIKIQTLLMGHVFAKLYIQKPSLPSPTSNTRKMTKKNLRKLGVISLVNLKVDNEMGVVLLHQIQELKFQNRSLFNTLMVYFLKIIISQLRGPKYIFMECLLSLNFCLIKLLASKHVHKLIIEVYTCFWAPKLPLLQNTWYIDYKFFVKFNMILGLRKFSKSITEVVFSILCGHITWEIFLMDMYTYIWRQAISYFSKNHGTHRFSMSATKGLKKNVINFLWTRTHIFERNCLLLPRPWVIITNLKVFLVPWGHSFRSDVCHLAQNCWFCTSGAAAITPWIMLKLTMHLLDCGSHQDTVDYNISTISTLDFFQGFREAYSDDQRRKNNENFVSPCEVG